MLLDFFQFQKKQSFNELYDDSRELEQMLTTFIIKVNASI